MLTKYLQTLVDLVNVLILEIPCDMCSFTSVSADEYIKQIEANTRKGLKKRNMHVDDVIIKAAWRHSLKLTWRKYIT